MSLTEIPWVDPISEWKDNQFVNDWSNVDNILKSGNEKNLLQMQLDIDKVQFLIAEKTKWLNDLNIGIKTSWPEQTILDSFLDRLGLEKNEETRFIAYTRIATMRDDGIRNYSEKNKLDQERKDFLLEEWYRFVSEYHGNLHRKIIQNIETECLLTPFYRAVLKWVANVWESFNQLYIAWNRELLRGVNPRLEARFDGDQDAIMKYLEENDLFDQWHDGKIADRSYSILQEKDEWYIKLAYAKAFPQEITGIILSLHNFIWMLDSQEDTVYYQKDEYITYLNALIDAFSEINTDALVEKWAQVDVAWMAISTPFQITHPLEYYEDTYRKAVAPEWDLRLKNMKLFSSHVLWDIQTMFHTIASEQGVSSESEISQFSLNSLNRTQLYIVNPFVYYGSCFTWLPSAQVVPNDTIVSDSHGKKIFSFAENILKKYRSQPAMKLSQLTMSEDLREKKKSIIFGPDDVFYQVYDIETIGHEFWHTLWLERDTETSMNVSGNYKNIEEWKATTGWLMAFFLNPDEELKEKIIVDLITRSVKLISWMKQSEVAPYYCEWLIHLRILFESGMIILDNENKVEMHFSDTTFDALKTLYLYHYKKLIEAYKRKEDASVSLSEYTIREGDYFLPKDEKLREFVQGYHRLYEEYGNTVAEDETK